MFLKPSQTDKTTEQLLLNVSMMMMTMNLYIASSI